MIFIGINGALGRMGSLICKRILFEKDISITEAFENNENPYLGKDLGLSLGIEEWKMNVSALNKSSKYKMNVLIDFSSKEGFSSALDFALSAKMPILSGTTGLDKEQMKMISEASKSIPVLYSTNMSTGINTLLLALDSMKPLLEDKGRDIEIIEHHHNQKKDSPSGTAITIAEKISKLSKREIEKSSEASFPRGEKIRIHSIRMGAIPGLHRIIISGSGETLELLHSADSRETFATGVITGIRFLAGKKKGLYSMIDALKEA